MAKPTAVPNKKIGSEQITDLSATHIKLPVRTAVPTTGLTKGEVFLLFHGSTPKLAVCSSTAAQTVKMVRTRTKTLGRLTA